MGDLRGQVDDDAACGLRPRGAAGLGGNDDPRPLPVIPRKVVLYHAPECHLCAAARRVLESVRAEEAFELEEIDISGDAALEARHREWLPVVEIDGERAFTYFVPPDALRRKLAQAAGSGGTL